MSDFNTNVVQPHDDKVTVFLYHFRQLQIMEKQVYYWLVLIVLQYFI